MEEVPYLIFPFLDFFENFQKSNYPDDIRSIQEYLMDITDDFSKIDGTVLKENEIFELNYHCENWSNFLVKNYYSMNLYLDKKCSDIDYSQKQFKHFKKYCTENNIPRIENILFNDRFDNIAIHIWIEFMNFFRIFKEYKTKERVEYNNKLDIDLHIKSLIKCIDANHSNYNKKLLDDLYNFLMDVSCIYVSGNQDQSINSSDIVEDENSTDIYKKMVDKYKNNSINNTLNEPIKNFPTFHQICSPLNLFIDVSIISDNNLIDINNENSSIINDNEDTIKWMNIIKKWVDYNEEHITLTEKTFIERLFYICNMPSCLPEVYIYGCVHNNPSEKLKKKAIVALTKSSRSKDSMIIFNKELSSEIDKYNPLNNSFNIFYSDKLTKLSESYFLIFFHKIVMSGTKYTQWIYRFLVLQRSYMKHKKHVLNYSKLMPLFIKINTYTYKIVHKKKFISGSVLNLINYWCENVKVKGIISAVPGDIPWIEEWKELVGGSVVETEIYNNSNITIGIPDINYVPKEIVKYLPDRKRKRDKETELTREDNIDILVEMDLLDKYCP